MANTNVVINTKVDQTAAAAFELCAKKFGTSKYQLIQFFIDTIIRYMSDRTNMSEEMQRTMLLFDHCANWDNEHINLCDMSGCEIIEAIYFLGRYGKKGRRAMLVERPLMGEPMQTFNQVEIFEKFFCETSPERYMQLRRIAAMNGYKTITEALDCVLTEYIDETYNAMQRSEFEDTSDYMKATQHYKRRPVRGMENSTDRQQLLDLPN